MIELYCTHTAIWRKNGGKDKWGKPIAGSDTTIKCRINWHYKQVVDKTGQIVVATGVVLMDNEPSLDDYLVIDNVQHPIVAKNGQQDASDSVMFWEVWIR